MSPGNSDGKREKRNPEPKGREELPGLSEQDHQVSRTIPECPPHPDYCKHCKQTYYVDNMEVECEYGQDCDGTTMTFEQLVVGDPGDRVYYCEWVGGGAAACYGRIECAMIETEQGTSPVWRVTIFNGPTGEAGTYRKPAHSTDCPDGVYTKVPGGGGGSCTYPEELTVYH